MISLLLPQNRIYRRLHTAVVYVCLDLTKVKCCRSSIQRHCIRSTTQVVYYACLRSCATVVPCLKRAIRTSMYESEQKRGQARVLPLLVLSLFGLCVYVWGTCLHWNQHWNIANSEASVASLTGTEAVLEYLALWCLHLGSANIARHPCGVVSRSRVRCGRLTNHPCWAGFLGTS